MVYYLETKSTDPYYNLAFEEYVLTHRTEGDYLLLWQNDNTVVVGRNQNTAEEINADFVEKYRINVVRRSTGGGAVYHDMGNLNYSFITDAGRRRSCPLPASPSRWSRRCAIWGCPPPPVAATTFWWGTARCPARPSG